MTETEHYAPLPDQDARAHREIVLAFPDYRTARRRSLAGKIVALELLLERMRRRAPEPSWSEAEQYRAERLEHELELCRGALAPVTLTEGLEDLGVAWRDFWRAGAAPMSVRELGWRREAESDRAAELYPFSLERSAADEVERMLRLPAWLKTHDQGREGSCVGHAVALERALTNTAELRSAGRHGYRRFDPISLWRAAKAVDEWSYTKPEDDLGTSVRAAYEIASTVGLARVRSMRLGPVTGRPEPFGWRLAAQLEHGVTEYRWIRTVDGVRAAIAAGVPVAIGVNWHTGFDSPQELRTGLNRRSERWLPLPAQAGRVRGGHSVTLAGASDRREAFLLLNSWGADYPPVWLPYATMARAAR